VHRVPVPVDEVRGEVGRRIAEQVVDPVRPPEAVGARGACEGIGIEDSDPSSGSLVTLVARPNPFTGRTTVIVEPSEDPVSHAFVCDVRGRPVAELTLDRLPDGRRGLTWDGRDSRGRRCPAGIYYLKVRTGTRELRCQLLLLR
jgi:hypothetical protein